MLVLLDQLLERTGFVVADRQHEADVRVAEGQLSAASRRWLPRVASHLPAGRTGPTVAGLAARFRRRH